MGEGQDGGCLISTTLQRARTLRKKLTDAEAKLWYHLSQRNLNGFRFRKQVPMERYIVDFICHEANLIIEVDGGGHNEDDIIKYDAIRTAWLETQGYTVKRFWNIDVLSNIDGVLEAILDACGV